MTRRGSITLLFLMIVRWVSWCCYLLILTSVLVFLLIEAHPPILELLKPERVAYYAIKATYVADDQLVFVKRARKYDWLTGADTGVTGGDQFALFPEYASLIRKWPYQASHNEDGFRPNSSTAPFQVAVIGDSLIAIGESDRATFSEELVNRTGLSVINLGVAWYGPHQYLQIFKRYVPDLKPRVVVIALSAGSDIEDVLAYEKWRETGQYYRFGGDQGRNIIYRYYAAMRDVSRVVRSDVSAFVARRLPSFHSCYVAIRDRLSAIGSTIGRGAKNALVQFRAGGSTSQTNVASAESVRPADLGLSAWSPTAISGFIKVGSEERPMAFFSWNPPYRSGELLQTREWRSLERIIATIKGDEQQSNVRVIWLLIPTKLEVYGRQGQSSDRSSVEFKRRLAEQLKFEDNFSEAFREIAHRLELEYLDLLPAFRQLAPNCVLYFPFDSHWNIYGRRVAASLLSELLRAKRSEMKQPHFDPSYLEPEFCGKASEYYNY